MNAISDTPQVDSPIVLSIAGQAARMPFEQETVLITKQELIDLRYRASYWKVQHAIAKEKLDALKAELLLKDALIKDLQNRLFGKKTEKNASQGSESNQGSPSKKPRGQQPGKPGPCRTPRPDLPVKNEILDLLRK